MGNKITVMSYDVPTSPLARIGEQKKESMKIIICVGEVTRLPHKNGISLMQNMLLSYVFLCIAPCG